MKAAPAREPKDDALANLGRATVRIVHDLKNQLNGLKLYATFLRKRLERDDRSEEERETLAKLIAGLDRAARDTTMLVRYAQPFDLRRQPAVDLAKIVRVAARDVIQLETRLAHEQFQCEVDDSMIGDFDPNLLTEAFKALSHEAVSGSGKSQGVISLQARRAEGHGFPAAQIEWRAPGSQIKTAIPDSFNGYQSAYAAFAARIIEAHGGTLQINADNILVSLPLSK